MAEPKYYIVPPFGDRGQWMTRPEIAELFNGPGAPASSADHIIDMYNSGTLRGSGAQTYAPWDPASGDEGYIEIPMSSADDIMLPNTEPVAGSLGDYLEQATGAPITQNLRGSRRGEVSPALIEAVSRVVEQTYGPGYYAVLRSGAGHSIAGTQRHTPGRAGQPGVAADFQIFTPDGRQLAGAELDPLARNWIGIEGSMGINRYPGERGKNFTHLDLIGGIQPYSVPLNTKAGEGVYWTYGGPDPRSTFNKEEQLRRVARGDVQPIVQASRLEPPPPPDSPALGARLAAGDEAPPSYPSVQETTNLLANLGYTGPDAVMRFQADNMGLAGTGGRTGPEFFAALTNPDLLGGLNITPRERPSWARGVDATMAENAPPTGMVARAARTVPQANDIDLMTMTDEAGNYLDPGATVPNPPPRPSWARGLDATTSFQKPPDVAGRSVPATEGSTPPTPRTRPVELAADRAGGDLPEGYRRLRLGSRGDDVRDVQAKLLAAGFNPGSLDGIYGPKTAAAVMSYQEARESEAPGAVGGKIDAIAGPFTQADLYNVVTNSTIGSLRDPGGTPGKTPSALEMGRLGWGREFEPRAPLGPPPPGTVPAGDRPFTGKPISYDGYGGEPFNTDPYSPELLRQIESGRPLHGVTMIKTRPGPVAPNMDRPFVAKPWGAEFLNTDPYTPGEVEHLNSSAPKVGVTVQPGGSRTPAPLSPTAVIQSLGGTGSSGLGAAGTSGPGMGGGSSSGFGGTDDDDDTMTGPGGYNESFSTTGWI